MRKNTVHKCRWAEFLRGFRRKVTGGHHYSCINGARCWSEGAKNNCPKIRIDESRTILPEGIQCGMDEKGGVIVFPADAGAVELSPDKVRDWLQTACGAAGWTIGHYLDGRYVAGNGAAFGENSLSAAIAGVGFDSLLRIGEDICRDFRQECFLAYDSADGRIVAVDGD